MSRAGFSFGAAWCGRWQDGGARMGTPTRLSAELFACLPACPLAQCFPKSEEEDGGCPPSPFVWPEHVPHPQR